MRKYFAIIILVFSYTLSAQNFTASVKNNTVSLDERFEVTFTFSGDDINKLRGFRPPDFTNFIILSGPNYSTSMQIINGVVNASQSHTYIVKAKSTGKFTISAASIDYGGRTFSTEPFNITVTAGSPQKKQQDDNSDVNLKEISENVFVRAIPEKTKAYKGEQIIVTYKLYTRLNISGINASKVSQQEGFWTEELEIDPARNGSIEVLDGKRFQVYTIRKIAVFPSTTGQLTITPYEFNIPVLIQKKRKGTGNLFDDFFNDPFFGVTETYQFSTKSNKLNITSLPLPAENVPESFKGAVGEFTMRSEISRTTTKSNDPVTLKTEISGNGNIALLSVPELKLSAGFELYEPKTTDNISRGSTVSGTKTIDYLIIPRTTGRREIPPVEFSYFSPSKKGFVTLKTPVYTINIEQGDAVPSGSYAGKEEIRLLNEDIRYIKMTSDDIGYADSLVLNKPGFWAAAFLPVIALAGLIFMRRRNEQMNSNLELMRYQRAEKIARNRFRQAKKFLAANNQSDFYAEISQALYGYLQDKFRIPKAEFSLVRAADEMRKKSVDESVVDKMISCSEKCEFFRFAPQKNGQADMQNMYNEMTRVIIDTEKSLTGGKR